MLFAWELGRGLGHLVPIRRMAARLKDRGLRTVAAVPDLTAISDLRDVCAEVVQAPLWPLVSQVPAQRAARSSATLNDILSSAGLADVAAMQSMLAQWDAILARTRPDLVIADFAPMAALAARGRVPLMLVGNGYTLPPDDMPRFPPLDRMSPPQWNEDVTLAAVNQAAQAMGLSQLDRLPQLFSGDARLVQTFNLLDPYDTQRREPLDGPVIDYEPRARNEDAVLIFVYLSSGYDVPRGLVDALRPFAGRLRMHAPGLAAEQRANLAGAGARIDSGPLVLADVLPSCRLVVHSGGSGLACEALLTGIPQLILSRQIEQTLNGRALRHAGVGELSETYGPAAPVSPERVAMLIEGAAMATRAGELGGWYRQYLSDRKPALKYEDICLALLR